MTFICVSKLSNRWFRLRLVTSYGQVIILNNVGILLIRPLDNVFVKLCVSSAKWRPLCLGLNGPSINVHQYSIKLSNTAIQLAIMDLCFINYFQLFPFIFRRTRESNKLFHRRCNVMTNLTLCHIDDHAVKYWKIVTSYEVALKRWISLEFTDDKLILVQVMDWCRQAKP